MDDAIELASYLPVSFKEPGEQAYIAFLWDAFESNYASSKYQFAFLAFHMLTMSFVYFDLWQIRRARPADFGKSLIGFGGEVEKSLLEAKTPFSFSTVNERSILRLLKLVNCNNSQIGTYGKLVDERNQTAHSNGSIRFSTADQLDLRIGEMLRVVREIERHSACIIAELYRDFLIQSHDAEVREYTDAEDQIREVLIHANYLSEADIAVCCAFDITTLATEPGYEGMRELHETLRTNWSPDA
jgi:hypothetical protein